MQVSSSPADNVVDLRDYLAVLRRRAALICLVTLGTTGLLASYTFTRTPVYTALAEVYVQPASASSQYRPDQLVSLDTEARLARSAQVAETARESLGWSIPIPDLLQHVSVQTTPETLVLDILFSSDDPKRAAAGADAFANGYLIYKRQRAEDADLAVRRSRQDQIDELQGEKEQLDRRIDTLIPGTSEFQSAQQERDNVNSQIAVLTSQLAGLPPVVDPGEVILPATVPISPSSPKHALNLAMGLFLGLFAGVVLAFVRDRFDERITGRSDLEMTLDAPVFAAIPRVAGWKKRGPVWLVTEQQPRSPAAEAYRTLRTAVLALNRQRDRRVIAITSPMVGEGKSTTTANLAVALAHADKRVLAISADLRRPSLHRYFRATNEIGLADVLLGEVPLKEAIQALSPKLWFLSSGRPSVRPAELLQSHRMADLLAHERDQFDFVLVDCPPVLGLSDTLAIAPFVDSVFLVAAAEISKRGAIVHAVDQLGQVGAQVHAGILNNVTLTRRSSGYGYGYGYGYGESGNAAYSEEPEASSSWPQMEPESTPARTGNGSGATEALRKAAADGVEDLPTQAGQS